MNKVLLVDDKPLVRKTLARLLTAHGYRVVVVSGEREAVAAASIESFAAAVVDIWMPDGNGLDLMRQLRAQHPSMPILVMSGGAPHSSLEYSLAIAEAEGAAAVLIKPFEDSQLLEKLATALGR